MEVLSPFCLEPEAPEIIPPPPVTQQELDRDPVGGAIHTYLHYRNLERTSEQFENTMDDNYDLLESLSGAEQEREKPEITICIPVAINREDPSTTRRALDVVSRAQQKFGKPVQVILWANAKYRDGNDKEAVSMEALGRYDSLRTSLRERQDGALEIRTALQVKPQHEASIGQVRANYMEAVALDVQKRHLGYDHPVMWIDADAIDISDNTFEQVTQKVRSFEDFFVHPMTHYGIDWHEGATLDQADAATKVVVIDEIRRRQENRNVIRATANNADIAGVYHEENGLAFAIGTYLSIGGLPAGQRANESRCLIDAALYTTYEAQEYYRQEHGMGPSDDVPLSVGFLPESTARKLTQTPKAIEYLTQTYTTMAARKQISRVMEEGPQGLYDIWTKNYRRLYVDEEGVGARWSDDQIHERTPVYIEHSSQYNPRITDQHKALLRRLVARYFTAQDHSPTPQS